MNRNIFGGSANFHVVIKMHPRLFFSSESASNVHAIAVNKHYNHWVLLTRYEINVQLIFVLYGRSKY